MSPPVRKENGGIAPSPPAPSRITAARSASLGSEPAGVERTLNSARVRSAGDTRQTAAAMPSPRPSGPWQAAQKVE